MELLTDASGMLVGVSEMLDQCYANAMNKNLTTLLNNAKDSAAVSRNLTEHVRQMVTTNSP